MSNIFISYSRRDQEFVRRLNQELVRRQYDTWVDWEDIPLTAIWWEEIKQGIEGSDIFIFVISPDSAKSKVCNEEIDHAIANNKRMVPILWRELENYPDLRADLSQYNWVLCRDDDDFEQFMAALIGALEQDLDHLKMHTRLLVKAKDWERGAFDDSYLLRGKDLADSLTWLVKGSATPPQPTALQLDYIRASQALPQRRVRLRTLILVTLLSALGVFGLRLFGGLQALELLAYDGFLRARTAAHPEAPDDRFLVIELDEASLRFLDETYPPDNGTLTDLALKDLLTRLQPYQPHLIGLDFYRNFDANPELAPLLRDTASLITVCKHQYGETDGIEPSPEVPSERIGFSDFTADGEGYIRRHLLMQAPDPIFCTARESFSLVLARRYLEPMGHAFQTPLEGDSYVRDMQLGSVRIPQLLGNGGGYQGGLEGYQTLLNFRAPNGNAVEFASRLSLKDILQDTIPADQLDQLVTDRIVMIGISAPSTTDADYWHTPYGDVPGVILQAQMASQLISAVLNNRPLIRWWPFWGEFLWILAWSSAGGWILWRFHRPLPLGVTLTGVGLILYGSSYFLLVNQAVWIPLVPASLAFFVTALVVGYLAYHLRKV